MPTIKETNVELWWKLQVAIAALQKISKIRLSEEPDDYAESQAIAMEAIRRMNASTLEESIKIGSEAFNHIPDAVEHIRNKRNGY